MGYSMGERDETMIKHKVLGILRREQDYVSGERISKLLGVSRMAVSLAIKTLRSEGYVIESSTKKGYVLSDGPDRLTTGELLGYLPEERMKQVICLDTVDSTNKRLKEMAMDGAPEGTAVIADHQTAGRGRLGRSFSSPSHEGIYLSYLMKPKSAPADVASLTAWAAVATARAMEKVYDFRPGIKWVNDLVWQGKKVCGILTEMSVESETGAVQYVVVGIGVNVRQEAFAGELEQKAVSLKMATGKGIPRAKLAAELVRRLDAMAADWPRQGEKYLAAYRERSVMEGKDITLVWRDCEKKGTAVAINPDFSLRVRFSDGQEEDISSGEVSVRGIYDGGEQKS